MPTGRSRLIDRVRKRAGKWATAVRQVLGLAPPRSRALVIGGLFVSSVLDLVGITMIVPLLMASADMKESSKGLVVGIRTLFESLGLPFAAWLILIVIVVGLALKGTVSIIVSRYVGDIVGTISRDMQIRLIRSILAARWSYFIRQPIGRLAFATGPEADAAGQCFNCLANVIAGLLQISLFVAVAAILSWQLLLISLTALLVMSGWFGSLVQRGRREAREHRRRMRMQAAKFTDTMIGIKPIRAMGRAGRFAAAFEADARLASDRSHRGVLSGEFAADLQEPIFGTLIAVGFYLAINGLHIELHELLLMAILMIRTVGALMPLQRQAQRFIQTYDQYRSLIELLRVTDDAREIADGSRPPRLEHAIRFENVSFSYGEKPVLKGLDLEIAAGKVTAIVGPSGVGKSTLVDLVVGLHWPSSGRVLIDGVDFRELDLQAWRQSIGYVPQELVLLHDTVLRNVTLYDDTISSDQVVAALTAAGAWAFVQALPEGLETIIGERGNRLSGGQRQRLAIARALIQRPRLLILDEATTGLDPDTERGICNQVRALCQQTGLTVLAVSHQPAWQQAADMVYRLGKPHAATAPSAPRPASLHKTASA